MDCTFLPHIPIELGTIPSLVFCRSNLELSTAAPHLA